MNFPGEFNIGSFTGPEKDSHLIAIITYLQFNLFSFVSEYKSKYTNVEIERGISQELCSYLQSKIIAEPFYFQAEDMVDVTDGHSPSVDIGIKNHTERKTIFSIEAKRLPLPTKRREKEYLIGNNGICGGVERFKRSIHGKGLSHSALLGYVQSEDFDYWFVLINSWIDELIKDPIKNIKWNKNDKLRINYIKSEIAELISINKRDDDSITLYHFWLNLVVN